MIEEDDMAFYSVYTKLSFIRPETMILKTINLHDMITFNKTIPKIIKNALPSCLIDGNQTYWCGERDLIQGFISSVDGEVKRNWSVHNFLEQNACGCEYYDGRVYIFGGFLPNPQAYPHHQIQKTALKDAYKINLK